MPLGRLLNAIGLQPGRPRPGRPPAAKGDDFVRKLERHLKRLGPDRLEYLAGFAGQLVRVAYADAGISDAEVNSITALVRKHADLTPAEARLVVDLVRHEIETLRSLQHQVLNRAINAHASQAEKQHLIDCVYAVAAADHLVSDVEEREIRRIATALMVSHGKLMDIRARYKEHLEVMKLAKSMRPRA